MTRFRIIHANGTQVGGLFKTRANAEKMIRKYSKHPAYDTTGWQIEETAAVAAREKTKMRKDLQDEAMRAAGIKPASTAATEHAPTLEQIAQALDTVARAKRFGLLSLEQIRALGKPR